jgi:hypothetical protein
MKKPILVFALKCTAIVYFVAFVNVKSFTTFATTAPENAVTKTENKQILVDKKMDNRENDRLLFTQL